VLGPLQRGGIKDDVVEEIDGVQGVHDVVPLIQAISEVDPGNHDDIAVTVLGFDCHITAILPQLEGNQACSDQGLSELPAPILGSRLAGELGARPTLRTNEGRVPLDPKVALPGLDSINAGRVVALPMAQARAQLGRPDGVDVVYVLPEPGRSVSAVQEAVQRALPSDYRVLDALDPPPVIGVVLATFLPLFTIIALLTLGIGAVLVRNSITLSLEERRRQTAIVGALGGSRSLLVGGTVLEVVVLGAVGGLLGDVFGIALAHPISGGLSDITRKIAGIPLTIEVPPAAMVVGVVVAVGVAILAAIGPARRAVRIDVAGELAGRGRREETAKASSPWRLLLAAVVILAGMALAAASGARGGVERWQSQAAPLGFLVVTVGSVGFCTISVPLLVGFLERRIRFRRASTRRGVSNLRREPRRSGVMALALGFAMGVGFVTASFNASVTQAIRTQLNRHFEGVQVTAIDPNNAATNEVRLSPTVLAGLAKVPGVRSVENASTVVVGNEARQLIGVQAYTDPWVDDGNFDARGHTSLTALAEGQATIGPALARSEKLRPGDLLRLPTPDGPVRIPVMAIVYDGNFGGRNVTLSYALSERLYGRQAPVGVIVKPTAGVTEADLVRGIKAADLDPGLIVEGRQKVIDRNAKAVRDQLSVFDTIQRGLLVMSFVAVLSTLLLVGIQRQREFGMLAAVGMTPSELRRMVLWEAAIVAILGVLVTGLAALGQFFALNAIVPVIIGYKDPWAVAPGAFVVYSLIALLTALLAAWYPARRASRVEVLEALRYE
jgi:putative ABC transport system permease protein